MGLVAAEVRLGLVIGAVPPWLWGLWDLANFTIRLCPVITSNATNHAGDPVVKQLGRIGRRRFNRPPRRPPCDALSCPARPGRRLGPKRERGAPKRAALPPPCVARQTLRLRWHHILYMPVMTGVELLQAMRADEKLFVVPFVLITAEAERKRVEEAIAMMGNLHAAQPCLVELWHFSAREAPRCEFDEEVCWRLMNKV